MGRFSPTQPMVPDTGIASALGNFTETYAQFASRRRQRDLDAVETGIGLTPADASTPQTAPSGPIAALRARLTGRTNPNDIADAIRNAAPAVQGANAVSSGIGDALSRGESYTPDNSGVPQLPSQMRLPSGQVISTAMTPIGQRLAQQRLAAIGMGSEIGLRQSEIAKNQRDASTPRLGDPNYAGAVAAVEGAKSQATLGPELQKLVAQGAISRQTALLVEQARERSVADEQSQRLGAEATQGDLNRTAALEREREGRAADLSNRLAEIGQTQRGQIVPRMLGVGSAIKGYTPPRLPGMAPATGAAAPGDVSAQRAHWDAAAAALRAKNQDPDTVLGARP